MIERLIRIALALAVAFVFTARMEAAAEHCARLAQEQASVADAPPCHGMKEAAKPEPKPHSPAAEHCECVAVLKACTAIATAPASTRLEPYAWARPEAVAFASIEPSPGLRPPRA